MASHTRLAILESTVDTRLMVRETVAIDRSLTAPPSFHLVATLYRRPGLLSRLFRHTTRLSGIRLQDTSRDSPKPDACHHADHAIVPSHGSREPSRRKTLPLLHPQPDLAPTGFMRLRP